MQSAKLEKALLMAEHIRKLKPVAKVPALDDAEADTRKKKSFCSFTKADVKCYTCNKKKHYLCECSSKVPSSLPTLPGGSD